MFVCKFEVMIKKYVYRKINISVKIVWPSLLFTSTHRIGLKQANAHFNKHGSAGSQRLSSPSTESENDVAQERQSIISSACITAIPICDWHSKIIPDVLPAITFSLLDFSSNEKLLSDSIVRPDLITHAVVKNCKSIN